MILSLVSSCLPFIFRKRLVIASKASGGCKSKETNDEWKVAVDDGTREAGQLDSLSDLMQDDADAPEIVKDGVQWVQRVSRASERERGDGGTGERRSGRDQGSQQEIRRKALCSFLFSSEERSSEWYQEQS